MARFGYVVLIPILILSGRLNQSESYALGIAVLVGYIFGSLFINLVHRFISLEFIAKFSLFIIACSFLACSVEFGAENLATNQAQIHTFKSKQNDGITIKIQELQGTKKWIAEMRENYDGNRKEFKENGG